MTIVINNTIKVSDKIEFTDIDYRYVSIGDFKYCTACEKTSGEPMFVRVRGLNNLELPRAIDKAKFSIGNWISKDGLSSGKDGLIKRICIDTPVAASYIMAIACEARDEEEMFYMLPLSKQIELLSHVYDLTISINQ